MENSWMIGVVLAALASIISNLGLNLQKLNHLRNSTADEATSNNYYKQKLWVFGLLLIVLGSIADFAALGFAAQSIVAPLGSFTLVANVFFAPLLLKESVTRQDLIGTAAIIAGSAISVTFASHQDLRYSVSELFGFYVRARFGFYAASVMFLLVTLWLMLQFFENEHFKHGDTPKYLRFQKYHRFSYAAASGIVGAQSVLFAKCISELVVNSITGDGDVLFVYYETYILLFCMGCSVFLQIKWLNQGLRQFDALYLVPVFQSFWILGSVGGGLIFFGEYSQMNTLSLALFPIGIVLTVAGVFWLSRRNVAGAAAAGAMDRTPLMSKSHEPIRQIDESIGFQGSGVPAAFTASAMGRCSIIFSAPTPSMASLARSASSIEGETNTQSPHLVLRTVPVGEEDDDGQPPPGERDGSWIRNASEYADEDDEDDDDVFMY